MRGRVHRIATVGVLAGVATVLAAMPVAADPVAMEFTGGGRGPTADLAVQGAVEDAEASAASEMLYTCTMIGEPQVFEVLDHPHHGHFFRAQVVLSCTS